MEIQCERVGEPRRMGQTIVFKAREAGTNREIECHTSQGYTNAESWLETVRHWTTVRLEGEFIDEGREVFRFDRVIE